MKLRLQSNSIRLRLKRGEVEQLARSGRVEENIIVGDRPGDIFHYAIDASQGVNAVRAIFQGSSLRVEVPMEDVSRWASGSEVGIERNIVVKDRQGLRILIEKDFACLTGDDKDNADTFPNPFAGTKC